MFQDADKDYNHDETDNLDTFVVYNAETNKQPKQTCFFQWPVKEMLHRWLAELSI